MSYIYFIGSPCQNLVKIGLSNNPKSRLSSIKSGSSVPLKLIAFGEGDKHDERKLHNVFLEYHSHLEWFHFSGRLAELIQIIFEEHNDDHDHVGDFRSITFTYMCGPHEVIEMDRWDFENNLIECGFFDFDFKTAVEA